MSTAVSHQDTKNTKATKRCFDNTFFVCFVLFATS
jgi:hypothetical protein